MLARLEDPTGSRVAWRAWPRTMDKGPRTNHCPRGPAWSGRHPVKVEIGSSNLLGDAWQDFRFEIVACRFRIRSEICNHKSETALGPCPERRGARLIRGETLVRLQPVLLHRPWSVVRGPLPVARPHRLLGRLRAWQRTEDKKSLVEQRSARRSDMAEIAGSNPAETIQD